MPLESVYESARLAEGYAFARPPVHPRIVQMIAEHLHITDPLACALDVGCGAGRSTDALNPIAHISIGLEPIRAMLRRSRVVAPHASFVVGTGEVLPFAAKSFNLITAAGSLNYADLDRSLPEALRVLAPDGALVIYDFSAGRHFRNDDSLDQWFVEFELRYPFQKDYALDVRAIDYARVGLRLDAFDKFEIALPLNAYDYLKYVLSETNVERAIGRGVPENEIRKWCQATINAMFGNSIRDVLFTGYLAYLKGNAK